MRILHAIDTLGRDSSEAAVACMALAAADAALGYDVVVLTDDLSNGNGASPESPRLHPVGDRVRLVSIPRLKLFGALYGDLRQHAEAFDPAPSLIHAHGFWEAIVLAAFRAARRARAPFVVSSHGELLRQRPRASTLAKRSALLAIGWRAMLRDARRVYCNTDEETLGANRLARSAVARTIAAPHDWLAVARQRLNDVGLPLVES